MFLGVLMVGVPFSLLLGGFLYLPYYLWHRKERRPLWRHLTVYAWLCFTILVLDATLLIGGIDFAPTYHFLNLAPFEWIRHPYEMGIRDMVSQLVLNVFMFIPFGVLLPMVFQRLRALWKTVLGAFGITVMIETLQYFTGRSADIDDVIMNVLGGVLGYGVFVLLNHCLSEKRWWHAMLGMASSNDKTIHPK